MGVGQLMKTKARVWRAPVGEALPTMEAVNYDAAWGGNWVDMGLTLAPLMFRTSMDVFNFEVEQYAAAVKQTVTNNSCEIETSLGEITPDNMALIFGKRPDVDVTDTAATASEPGYSTFNYDADFEIHEYAFGFEGRVILTDNNSYPIRFFVPRGTYTLNGDLEFSARSSNPTAIPFKLTALSDPANSGRLYTFEIATAVPTG